MASPLSILKTVLNLNHNRMHVTSCERVIVSYYREFINSADYKEAKWRYASNLKELLPDGKNYSKISSHLIDRVVEPTKARKSPEAKKHLSSMLTEYERKEEIREYEEHPIDLEIAKSVRSNIAHNCYVRKPLYSDSEDDELLIKIGIAKYLKKYNCNAEHLSNACIKYYKKNGEDALNLIDLFLTHSTQDILSPYFDDTDNNNSNEEEINAVPDPVYPEPVKHNDTQELEELPFN